jgi:hypothetical protein
VQLDGLFETLIGDSVTIAGNHRCILQGVEKVPSGPGSILIDHRDAPCATDRHYRHWSGTQAEGSTAPGLVEKVVKPPTRYGRAIAGQGFTVRGMAGNLDRDDVLGHVVPVVRAERYPGDLGAQEGASCLAFSPARQLALGKQAFVLCGLLGTARTGDA